MFGAAAKPFGLGGFGGGGVGGFGTGGQVPLVDKYRLSKQGLAALIRSSSVDRMTAAWQSFRSSGTGEAMASMGVCSPGVLYNIIKNLGSLW